MKKGYLVLVFITIFVTISSAQSWTAELPDQVFRNFIFTDNTDIVIVQNDASGYQIKRFNEHGTVISTKSIGFSGYWLDKVTKTYSNGYIFLFEKDSEYTMLKIDQDFNTLFQKSYPQFNTVYGVAELTNSSDLMALVYDNGSKLYRLNSSGEPLSNHSISQYGGLEFDLPAGKNSIVYSSSGNVTAKSSGGSTIWSQSFDNGSPRLYPYSSGYYVMSGTTLAKLNEDGQKLWQKPVEGVRWYNFLPLNDGSFISTGSEQAGGSRSQTIINKFDTLGNLNWSMKLDTITDLWYSITNAVVDSDKNLYLTGLGMTTTYDTLETVRKIDPAGNVSWKFTFDDHQEQSFEAYTVLSSQDQVYSFCNSYSPFPSKLYRLDTALITANIPSQISDLKIKTYPNPASDRITFTVEGQETLQKLLLFNKEGKIVRSFDLSGKQFSFHKENLEPGVCFYKLHLTNKQTATGKVVIK